MVITASTHRRSMIKQCGRVPLVCLRLANPRGRTWTVLFVQFPSVLENCCHHTVNGDFRNTPHSLSLVLTASNALIGALA